LFDRRASSSSMACSSVQAARPGPASVITIFLFTDCGAEQNRRWPVGRRIETRLPTRRCPREGFAGGMGKDRSAENTWSKGVTHPIFSRSAA
jgi:hypothetical protein